MTKDMTKGSPVKLLLAFGIPLLIGNTFQQFYSIVDTAVVGRGVGVSALAAVGSTGSLNWMVIGFITGMTHGFSILISQFFGKRDNASTRKTVVMAIYLSIIISIIFSVLGAIFSKDILKLMNTPQDILNDAALYISIVFGGTVAVIFYNITASILRALGNSMTPLLVIIAGSVVNVILDLLFVMVFKWGVAGAAIATVLANLFCGIVCFISVIRIPMLKMSKDDLKWDNQIALKLIRLGLPVGLMNSVTAIGNIILQGVVNSLGSATVAAYTLGVKIIGLADQASCIVGLALGTFVAQNIGAGNLSRTREGVRKASVISIAFSVMMSAVLVIFGKPITALFVPGGETQVVSDAYPYLLVCGLMIWSLGMLFVFRYSLQGLGDTVVPMFSGLVELALRLGMVTILPISLGFYRICFAEVSAWFGAMLMLGIAYFVRMSRLSKKFGAQ